MEFPSGYPLWNVFSSNCYGQLCHLEPAEQSSVTAEQLFNLFLKSGIPEDAVAFLPGDGEKVGKTLVEDPRVD